MQKADNGDKINKIPGNFDGSTTKISGEAQFALVVLKIKNAWGLEAPLTSPSHVTGGYLSRSATYTPVSTSATLKFSLLCPRFMQLTAQSNYALIAITLTNSNRDMCPATKIKK